MIDRKYHLEQINRFHDMVDSLTQKIKSTTDCDKRGELSLEYFRLTTHVWPKIDDNIEAIKDLLDRFEREKK